MKITGDNRSMWHCFDEPQSGVYTLIFPTEHSLKKRYETLQYMCSEILFAMKLEEQKIAEEKKKKEEKEQEPKNKEKK